ncbi:DUF397 domain-containing protein [Nocardiopsis potens]|uniref:DUF397 domain-containing protein n=1 Tax=Nocardiopsis potens TaxID=1246458 RepID=UPI00034BFDA3|nr:DUF397 domain-containing protein [Nocardiopsis potens]
METWKKSSYSHGNGGACVEVAEAPQAVKMRDTQNRERGHLAFPRAEWQGFLDSVKRGRL